MFRKKRRFYFPKKDYSNPFFQGRRIRRISLSPALSWRVRFIVLAALLLIAALLWFIFFSNFFNIKTVEIEGVKRISPADAENLVWQQTGERRFMIGSQKNIILFDAAELTSLLKGNYGFKNLAVKKKLPGSIFIKLEESEYAAIWHENDKYYYVDNEGTIITEVNPLDIDAKNYILIDWEGGSKISNGKIGDEQARIAYIIKLAEEFKNNKRGMEIERFSLDNNGNSVKMAVKGGPVIYFNARDDMNKQVAKLFVLSDEKLKDDFYKKAYIDLRYGDKVYYK
ncbi:hypothetical protein HY798_04255 [Candidatus Falkowbacteria bacterium]|nr:hypothetical protein [Candidatus Falkowbacteria bacterium]